MKPEAEMESKIINGVTSSHFGFNIPFWLHASGFWIVN